MSRRRVAAAIAAAVGDCATYCLEYEAHQRTDQRQAEWFDRCWETHTSVFGPLYRADQDVGAETAYEDTVAELLGCPS